MQFALRFPWNNLGCLGLRCGRFYADVFRTPYWGVFYSNGRGLRKRVRVW